MRNSNDTIGVALTKELCPVCCKEQDGDIVMNTVLSRKNAKEVEELHNQVVGFADKPCIECLDAVGDGVYLIEVDAEKTNSTNNPYRTGRQWGLKLEAFKRVFKDVSADKQMVYIPSDVAEQMGL